MKNHSHNLHAPFCGIFCPNSVAVARLFKEDIEDGEPVITVEYHPVEYGKDYDIVNNPNEFQLYVDGKEIEE